MSNPDGDFTIPGRFVRVFALLVTEGTQTLERRNGSALGQLLPVGTLEVVDHLAASARRRATGTVDAVPCTSSRTGDWLSAGQAAELAGLSVRQAERLARGGRLIARRAGRRTWLIDADSARDYGRARRGA